MSLQLTLFEDHVNNRGTREFEDLQALAEFLKQEAKRSTGQKSDKNGSLSFVPAVVEGPRQDANVKSDIQFLCIDFDHDAIFASEKFLQLYNPECIIYDTFSSTRDEPRLRLIAAISRPLTRQENKLIREYLVELVGIVFDESTNALSSQFYAHWLPADGSQPRCETLIGTPLDIDSLLLEANQRKTQLAKPAAGDAMFPGKQYKLSEEEVDEILDHVFETGGDENQGRRNSLWFAVAGFLLTRFPGLDDVWLEALTSAYPPDEARKIRNRWDKLVEDRDAGQSSGLSHLKEFSDCAGVDGLIEAFEAIAEDRRQHMQASDAALMHDLKEAEANVQHQKAKAAELGFSVPEYLDDIANLLTELYVDSKHRYQDTDGNRQTILRLHPEWKGRFRYNTLKPCVELDGKPMTQQQLGEVRSFLINHLRANIVYGGDYLLPARNLSLSATPDVCKGVALTNSYNPIEEYMGRLPEWDGEPRVDNWVGTVFGVHDDLSLAIGRLLLMAMVRRAREPGCKYDYVMVVKGGQGIGKSLALKSLVWDQSYFDDNLKDMSNDRDNMAKLRSNWLIELGEMSALLKTKTTGEAKTLITSQYDKSRGLYTNGDIQEEPRLAVFVGTTNDAQFFSDLTGNRRFVVVEAKQADYAWVQRNRDQLFAEAKLLEPKTGALVLPRRLQQMQNTVNEEYTIRDEILEAQVEAWVTPLLEKNENIIIVNFFTANPSQKNDKWGQMRVAELLKDKYKLSKRRKRVGNTQPIVWERMTLIEGGKE